ncbi:MAG: flagellar hook-associated protein FlgK [Pseudomonadota bacterium]
MSLDVAANIARQSLIATQSQIALSGRNVAAASDPDRSRAYAVTATTVDGGVAITQIRRAEDAALYATMIRATASAAERDAVLIGLQELAVTVGDPQDGVSPAARIGDLRAAIADYANAPDDPLFGKAAVERAHDLADGLNRAANDVNLLRERADQAMAEGVGEVNRLLAEFDAANTAVTRATALGNDATMDLDRRDGIVSELSQYLGVTTLTRENNDMALFTDGGITLFDKEARSVTMQRTTVFTAATVGGTVFVDGLPITGDDAPMPSEGGSIVGWASVRDTHAVTYRLQLDEIARTLTEVYDDGVGSLFVNAGPPDYAGTLAVNPSVDPAQGGTVENLRDGTGNPSGFAAYSDRLLQLDDDLGAIAAFDPNAELGANTTVQSFASGSVGWLEGLRSTVTGQATTERAILARASDALSRATGVNMDDEFAQQLEIERNFAASSRLLGIIDDMYESLLRIA